jgi:hypothetical protein|nr:MAG: hypothetical protein [Bacteriophage sp.]DAL45028.1 MAG TPA_asm: hypothetical protein [Caudoviricetes sp.]
MARDDYFDNNFLQKVKKSLTDPDKIIGLMK